MMEKILNYLTIFDLKGYYPILINIFLIIVVGLIANFIIRYFLNRSLKRVETSENKTRVTFLRNGINAVIYLFVLIGIIYVIPGLRAVAFGFFAGASILAAIIGFASQKAFSNIVSGVFIVMFKPFRVDDIIKIQNEIGTVEDITLRHTVIRGLENKRLIYPNSIIDSETIINWTISDEKVNKYMFISIDMETDLEHAIRIIQEESLKHPDLLDMRTEEEKGQGIPQVQVPVLDFEKSMVNFRIPLWAKDLPTAMSMIWDIQKAIKLRFDQEGITMGRPPHVIYEGKKKWGVPADNGIS